MKYYKKIDETHDIYCTTDPNECPKTVELKGNTYYRFMNFFYIPDYVYNLDEEYVTILNDLRYIYKEIVIDYNYNKETEQRTWNSLQKYVNTAEKLRILDFGCGEGNCGNFIKSQEQSTEIQGVDLRNIDKDFLHNYNSFQQITTTRRIPFENNYFDLSIALFVFHFKITTIQLESLYKTLRKGGILCFNLIQSADKNILSRLTKTGFSQKEEVKIPFGNKTIEYYIFTK